MSEPSDEERVSKKVIVEHTASTGSSKNAGYTIAVIAVIAIALIIYIVLHMK
ncbi:MAG: hypothetical protein ACXVIJ_13065 [Thermoanaerobaculia bacterium]